MKKLVLKYLPILLALIIAFAGYFTLSSYSRNRSEYAVVSFNSKALSLDLTVSQTGFVVKVMPANVDSQEKLAEFDIKGMNIADAISELSDEAEKNETIFVGVYVNEDEDIEPEDLKSLLDIACSKLSVSCVAAYGTYENYDSQRSVAYKQTIGMVSFIKDYADLLYSELSIYIDTLYVYDMEPYDIAFYAEYIYEKNEIENYKELLSIDLSHYKKERDFLSVEEAQDQMLKFIQEVFVDEAEDLYYVGYQIDRGYLAHAFKFRVNGENRVALVNVYNGSTTEYFLDDY